MVPRRIEYPAHDEILRIREGEIRDGGFLRGGQDGHGQGKLAKGLQNPFRAVEAVDKRFHHAHQPRGEHEIPIALVVGGFVDGVEGVAKARGQPGNKLAGLPRCGFQPFRIGQRLGRHEVARFLGGGGRRAPRPGQRVGGRVRVFRERAQNERGDG